MGGPRAGAAAIVFLLLVASSGVAEQTDVHVEAGEGNRPMLALEGQRNCVEAAVFTARPTAECPDVWLNRTTNPATGIRILDDYHVTVGYGGARDLVDGATSDDSSRAQRAQRDPSSARRPTTGKGRAAVCSPT
ncbi:MAG TPA: hypothetical protein VM889_13070 [Candidatus Thermoplasmatota archaeon]|nr:hypothetical protein [Candidatus Thermoplasmatota archaeon]